MLAVLTDEETLASEHWKGRLAGDAAGWSVIMLRWLLLLQAVSADENLHARPFRLVLRMRPDALLVCVFHWQLEPLSPFNALTSNDYAVQMASTDQLSPSSAPLP